MENKNKKAGRNPGGKTGRSAAPEQTRSDRIPGYIKMQHLLSPAPSPELPSHFQFLLRLLSLTDSVIAFNDAKRLTNRLQTVANTVGQMMRRTITERHYMQLKFLCGEVYTYTEKPLKTARVLVVEKEQLDMHTRVGKAGRSMGKWVEERGGAGREDAMAVFESAFSLWEQSASLAAEAGATDFPDPIKTKITPSEEGPPDKSPVFTPTDSPPQPKGPKQWKTLLERIEAKEKERRLAYIELQKEKDRELQAAAQTMYMLFRVENKRTLEAEYVTSKIRSLASGQIKMAEVVLFPDHREFLEQKRVQGRDYITFHLERYEESNFANKRS